jgi:hypothetical protein
MRNNFQRLQEEELTTYPQPPARIKEDINHSQNMFQLVGNVIDLFIPKLFQMIASMLGGGGSTVDEAPENKPPRYPNLES